MRKSPIQVSPPPIDASMQGAPNSVSSQPTSQPQVKKQPAPTPQAQPQAQAPGTDAAAVVGDPGTDKPRLSYAEMYQLLNPNKPETAEERAKREKREKSEAAIAAVGDTISALSNLWFTSQYAPNAYDPSKGMSAATKERWEKLRQEREANRRAYTDGYFRALAMDDANNKDDRNWRHTIEREKIADQRYEVKAAQEKALADLNEQLKRHQITAAEHKAEQERIKAQFAEETERLEQEYRKAGIQQRRASAANSMAAAGSHAYGTFDGRTYRSEADYKKAVLEAARGYNERHKRTEKVKRTDDETVKVGNDGQIEKNEDVWVDEVRYPIEISWTKKTGNGEEPRLHDIIDIAAKLEPLLKEEREADRRKKSAKDDFSQYEVRETNDFSQYEKK